MSATEHYTCSQGNHQHTRLERSQSSYLDTPPIASTHWLQSSIATLPSQDRPAPVRTSWGANGLCPVQHHAESALSQLADPSYALPAALPVRDSGFEDIRQPGATNVNAPPSPITTRPRGLAHERGRHAASASVDMTDTLDVLPIQRRQVTERAEAHTTASVLAEDSALAGLHQSKQSTYTPKKTRCSQITPSHELEVVAPPPKQVEGESES